MEKVILNNGKPLKHFITLLRMLYAEGDVPITKKELSKCLNLFMHVTFDYEEISDAIDAADQEKSGV